MSVEVKIYGEAAEDALRELRVFSEGLAARAPSYAGPLTSDGASVCGAPLAMAEPGVVVAETSNAAQDVAAEPEPPKKRARRTKAEIEAERAAGHTAPEPEPTPEDDAQDAADEAAEDEAASVAELTHEDVRAALGAYVKRYGMEAAQEDGPRCIALVLTGDMNATKDGAAYKVSSIPNEQGVLRKVVDGIEEMGTRNPFKRTPVDG